MDSGGTAGMLASNMGTLPEPLAAGAAWLDAMAGLPFPQVLVIAGAALEIVAGVLIALGTH